MKVTILGVGNTLFTDEGTGIRVAEYLSERYTFDGSVSLVDGGTLGLGLLGVMGNADYLIVVDAVRNGGAPGSLYRLCGDEIPKRVFPKNSLHQVDLIEALTLCQVLDKVPETVVIGVEPLDIETFGIELTPTVSAKISAVAQMVLDELKRIGVAAPRPKESDHVPCHSRKDR